MENGKVFIWMNLMGFEKNDEDKGVARFLNDTGFVPEGACRLVCHPDFVHHYRGMDEEYVLYPDNCSYNGVPRNIIRERQDWTNYDLRALAKTWKKSVLTCISVCSAWIPSTPAMKNGSTSIRS